MVILRSVNDLSREIKLAIDFFFFLINTASTMLQKRIRLSVTSFHTNMLIHA